MKKKQRNEGTQLSTSKSLNKTKDKKSIKNLQHRNGYSLRQYSEEKCLPIKFLKRIGLSEQIIRKLPAIVIPYRDETGVTVETLHLTRKDGIDSYEWKKKPKPLLYGLDRLDKYRKRDHIVLANSEIDCHLLWHHKVPAIGMPYGEYWQENAFSRFLKDFKTIYLIIGKFDNKNDILSKFNASSLKNKIKITRLVRFTDLTKMHLNDPDKFKKRIIKIFEAAVTLKSIEKTKRKELQKRYYELAEDIPHAENILKMFLDDIPGKGLTGEENNAKALYLALSTRFFPKPINVIIKGGSSSGKSHTVKSVLKYFPPESYTDMTGATEKALVRSEESFKNRFIVIQEAAGTESAKFLDYIIRILISEGRIIYKTIEGDLIKEGPIGFITTTTNESIHPENETRYISLHSDDTRKQTKDVLLALGKDAAFPKKKGIYNWDKWHAFQMWLCYTNKKVKIPYATALAKSFRSYDNTRLRRDMSMILDFIRAHAVIHQKNRKRTEDGHIIADKNDYRAIYKILAKPLSMMIGDEVSDTVKETVREVKKALKKTKADSISMTDLAKWMGVHKGTASKNVKSAINAGFLVNDESRKGRGAKLKLGVPIGKRIKILPNPKTLWEAYTREKEENKKKRMNKAAAI